MKQELEHPFNWLAKKQRCTHFIHGSVNSSPANNSELLYDGSAEAREILRNASNEAEGVSATMVVNHALDYLKGKDIVSLASFTAEIMTPLDNCEVCKGESGGTLGNENVIDGVIMCDHCTAKKLLPAVKLLESEEATTKTEKLVQIAALPISDDAHNEEYPEWSVQNQEPVVEETDEPTSGA